MPAVADDTKKIVERVKKLLRLAAPDSGAAGAERESAALEAGLLIAKYGFAVEAVQPKAAPVLVAPHAWHFTESLNYAGCDRCGGPISPRDVVWKRIAPGLGMQLRHRHCWREGD